MSEVVTAAGTIQSRLLQSRIQSNLRSDLVVVGGQMETNWEVYLYLSINTIVDLTQKMVDRLTLYVTAD